MKLVSVTLSGELRGPIWWPYNEECYKHFEEKFTPDDRPFTSEWQGMRKALLRITNDGDFQYCGIEECYIKVVWLLPNGRLLTHHAEVTPCKAIADLFAN